MSDPTPSTQRTQMSPAPLRTLLRQPAFCALLLLAVACVTGRAQVDERLLPTLEQVGAGNLPAAIAPISAPFRMPQFARATFPDRKVEVTVADPKALATQAIQSAIDDVAQKGGGTVVIPAGVWNTGRLVLKSNVNLHVSEGATLAFSGRVEDYQPAVFTRNEGVEVMSLGALIYANGQRNIAVTGKGKLIGPPLDGPMRRQKSPESVDKIDAKTPVAERVYDGRNGGPVRLPTFIGPVNCQGVFIEGVSIEQSATWNVVPVYCEDVIIRGVTIHSVNIPTGDGIDVDSSRRVLIEYCTFSCGDDCIAIKAGRGADALRVDRPSESIVIRKCLVLKGHAGVATGSETGGRIRNVYASDCVFLEPVVGIRFKTRRPRGGGGQDLTYERIRIGKCSTAIAWDMLGEAKYVGEAASRYPLQRVNKLTPFYRDITVRNVLVDQALVAVKVFGIPESPATDVLIENLTATTVNQPVILNDVKRFELRNALIRSAVASIPILDGKTIMFEKCQFEVPGGEMRLEISGEFSGDIRFRRSSQMRSIRVKGRVEGKAES